MANKKENIKPKVKEKVKPEKTEILEKTKPREKAEKTEVKEKKKINPIKLLKTTSSTLLFLLLAVATSVLVLATIDTPLNLKVFNVTSGSMEPSIKLGTLVFVRPVEEYKKEDVITFYPKALTKETVTHRIFSIEKSQETGATLYRTKGDANETEDMSAIPVELIIGKVIFKLPFIGHVLAFTKTQMGFIFLIVVPATIIIWSELGSIKKEVMLYIEERREKKKLNS